MHVFRPILGTAVALLAACAAPAAKSPEARPDPGALDAEIMRVSARQFNQYVDAMLLCGSPTPREWEEARRLFEILHPYFVFREDPDLIRQFRAGSETARKELARRGVLLQAVLVFKKPYDRGRWDEARKTLLDAGEAGQSLLTTTLLQMLLDGHHLPVWSHVRYTLVELGPFALETTAGLAQELARVTPGDAPVFKIEDLTQVSLVLIGFGDAGRPHMMALAKHEKANVRRAVARAIGESTDAPSVPILAGLLAEDPEWIVRGAAAEAMGRMGAVRSACGPALVARIGQERDSLVLRLVLRAIGDLRYAEAVPALVRALEVPSRETAEAAMISLAGITGERFQRREQWDEWYRAHYPAWKQRQGRSR